MLTHDEMVAKWMKDPAFKAEYERIEREEMPMLDAILSVRKQAKLALAAHPAKIRPSRWQAGADQVGVDPSQ
jgi:hypothetical protein